MLWTVPVCRLSESLKLKIIHVNFSHVALQLFQSIANLLSPGIPFTAGLRIVRPSSTHLRHRRINNKIMTSRYHRVFCLLKKPVPTVHKIDIYAFLIFICLCSAVKFDTITIIDHFKPFQDIRHVLIIVHRDCLAQPC